MGGGGGGPFHNPFDIFEQFFSTSGFGGENFYSLLLSLIFLFRAKPS